MNVKCNKGEAITIAILVAVLIVLCCWEIARGDELRDIVAVAADEAGLPLGLVEALIYCESSWDDSAIGDDGKSIGLMQINWAAHRLDREMLFDPVYNVEFGCAFLKELCTIFEGDTLRALTAWNFGVSKTLQYNLYVGNHALRVWRRYERLK